MLKWVDIVSYDAAKQKGEVVGRCVLEDGKVRIEGDAALKERLSQGIALGPNRKVTPEQGEEFLQALGREFKGGHLFATDVHEGDKVEEYRTPPMRDVEETPPAPPHLLSGEAGGPPAS